MFEADGRVALVTGAGQNMGADVAQALAAQGAVVAVNDIVASRAEAVAAALAAKGLRAVPAPFDVTDGSAVRDGVAAIARTLGPIDILVNNAGVPAELARVPFRQRQPSQWRPYVELNVYGSLLCIRAVIDGMCKRRWGRIVQISSGAGRAGVPSGISLYGASKSGIEGFVRHLSREVAGDGVTVNALALGVMANAVQNESDALKRLVRTVPVGRLSTPGDVGATVVCLVSDEASFLTGQTIHLGDLPSGSPSLGADAVSGSATRGESECYGWPRG
jgi:NAD(P)-dependent dehydrogenase (short-subunit alcohol dehydrogenase family)